MTAGTMTSTNRQELAGRIAETAVLRGNFTLRSGRTSTWYIDKYRFLTQPELLAGIGALMAEALPPETTRLAGAELGGVPLVAATSMATGLPGVYVRNSKKEYGTGRQLEGPLEPGDKVVIVEDVATTGGQAIEAARVIVDEGAEVLCIIATVDRCEGARENVEGAGFAFKALFTVADLGIET